jgi:hypothetical protein
LRFAKQAGRENHSHEGRESIEGKDAFHDGDTLPWRTLSPH